MATHVNDFANNTTIGSSLTYQTRNATAQGTGVDLQNGDGHCFGLIIAGVVSDGTHTVSVEESRNNNSADAGGAADPYAATSPVVAATPSSSSVSLFNFTRSKRYARAVTTVVAGTTGGIYGVLLGTIKKYG